MKTYVGIARIPPLILNIMYPVHLKGKGLDLFRNKNNTAWLARLGYPSGWHGSAARRAVSFPLPGWDARLRQPICWFGPASLLAASARLHQPTSWLGPASRLARFGSPAAWHVSVDRLAGTIPLPG
jgi:hypothetical protein